MKLVDGMATQRDVNLAEVVHQNCCDSCRY